MVVDGKEEEEQETNTCHLRSETQICLSVDFQFRHQWLKGVTRGEDPKNVDTRPNSVTILCLVKLDPYALVYYIFSKMQSGLWFTVFFFCQFN